MSERGGSTDVVSLSEREATRTLEAEIAEHREELSSLVAELDGRRHAIFDIRRQVKRHALPVALSGISVVGAASAMVWLLAQRARRRERMVSRVGRLRQAVSRMADSPDRVAAEPTIPAKIFTAAASAVVATATKKLLARWLQGMLERRQRRSQTPPRSI